MTSADPARRPAGPSGIEKTSALALAAAPVGMPGVVAGQPLTWLRIEALAVAGAALFVFARTGHNWWLVPALFLVPDLSWFGYLVGPRAGAWIYNLAHSGPLPVVLLAAGAGWHVSALTVAGAVGLFHIGVDRVLKYGLKYDHSFAVTHLGVHGKH